MRASHLVFATGLLAAPAAQAQMFYGPPVLPERAIVGALHSEGFRRLSPPVLNRDVYVLDALDPYGDPVRIIVSAYDGRIVAAYPQRGGREGDMPRGGRWGGLPQVDQFDDDDDVVTPTQPRVAPRPPRQAAVPQVKVDPPKVSNPALTPKNPTVVKTSPLAIPKDKDASDDKSGKPPIAAMPGTKTVPRVIPIAPVTAAPAQPAAPAVPAQRKEALLPPPAVLDDGGMAARPVTPQVPPAPLE